ncbi:acyl carrier protein [Spinactinospora alkalitolerans]|uniref:Acyl carrier protein n=1 Tax=Spinactinospora alkalitolerans TaxID=687207 RepID=A0A852U175_9ACTN|nr:phosphopantetheine-binding protein [Spinactinospora alkalitolerans]NYE50596.1 acyl carrier protein [Spinactinospora alkalitolerans]
MSRQEIITAITAALSSVLEREVEGTTEETRLFDELHLDSTSVLELLMSIEDGTGIEVDPENLDMNDFASVGTLATYLQSQEAAPTGAEQV